MSCWFRRKLYVCIRFCFRINTRVSIYVMRSKILSSIYSNLHATYFSKIDNNFFLAWFSIHIHKCVLMFLCNLPISLCIHLYHSIFFFWRFFYTCFSDIMHWFHSQNAIKHIWHCCHEWIICYTAEYRNIFKSFVGLVVFCCCYNLFKNVVIFQAM